jgi:mRNA interferase MazF
MRPLHWATLDQCRPVLLLTREVMVGRMSTITVAPVTSTIHDIATEVLVGSQNGLDQASAIKCDQILSIPFQQLHDRCGWLFEAQEPVLHEAVQAAFDFV